ncbi:hypothetical protein [Brevundimonas diminuta]|uniref:hypothetical protein n=1 Tax=Brevundimonas diminuta TaxID=293 RepID=UPI0030FA7AC4
MKHFALALALALAPTASLAQDFDFRGARLGMSLDEFNDLPPINGGRTSCSTMRQLSQPPTSSDSIAGVLLCSREGDAPFAESDFVRQMLTRVSYRFLPDSDDVPRLWKIEMRVLRANVPQARTALIDRFGPPERIDQSQLTNLFGARFTRDTDMWSNETSNIFLASICESIEYGCVAYIQNDLTRVYESKTSQSSYPSF